MTSLERRKLLLAGAGVLVLALAAGVWAVFRRPVPPVTVAASRPVSKPVSGDLVLSGRIQARNLTGVRIFVEGAIANFSAQVGDEVREGEVLAEIQNGRLVGAEQSANEELARAQTRVHDLESEAIAARLASSESQAGVTRAHVQLDVSEKAYARQQMLMREGATPRLVFEKAEKDYNAAKADSDALEALARAAEERMNKATSDLDHARAVLEVRSQELENTKAGVDAGEVRSPVNGVVVTRRGQVGDRVTPDIADLFQIATDLNALVVSVEPGPAALAKFHGGQNVEIRVVEAPNETIVGMVREVKGSTVLIDFTSPSPAVRPGLSAEVRVAGAR